MAPNKQTVVNAPVVIPQHKDLYTIPETAVRMSTTVFAIRELCRSGELKYVPIGHAWLISPGAIQTLSGVRKNCSVQHEAYILGSL
jgi:hypothetical protein